MYSLEHILLSLFDVDFLLLVVAIVLALLFLWERRKGEAESTSDRVIKVMLVVIFSAVFLGFNGFTIFCAKHPKIVTEPLVFQEESNKYKTIMKTTDYDFYDSKGRDVELTIFDRYHDEVFQGLKLEEGQTYQVTYESRFLMDVLAIEKSEIPIDKDTFTEVVRVNKENDYLVDPPDQKFGYILPIILAFGMIFFMVFDSEGHVMKGLHLPRRIACLAAIPFFIWLAHSQYQSYKHPVLLTKEMTYDHVEIHNGSKRYSTDYYFNYEGKEYDLYLRYVIEPNDEVIRSRVGNDGLVKGKNYLVTYEDETLNLYDVRAVDNDQ